MAAGHHAVAVLGRVLLPVAWTVQLLSLCSTCNGPTIVRPCAGPALKVVELVFLTAAAAVPVGLLRLVGGTFLLAAVAANCLKVRGGGGGWADGWEGGWVGGSLCASLSALAGRQGLPDVAGEKSACRSGICQLLGWMVGHAPPLLCAHARQMQNRVARPARVKSPETE
jgi:hypothetical protein